MCCHGARPPHVGGAHTAAQLDADVATGAGAPSSGRHRTTEVPVRGTSVDAAVGSATAGSVPSGDTHTPLGTATVSHSVATRARGGACAGSRTEEGGQGPRLEIGCAACGVDLVTGTPPYFPVARGGLPPCEESAACLFEVRGGVEEYCAAASRIMAPDGVFVVCETAAPDGRPRQRVLLAARRAGLRVLSILDVSGRVGKAPLFSTYVMVRLSSPRRARAVPAIEAWTEHVVSEGGELLAAPSAADGATQATARATGDDRAAASRAPGSLGDRHPPVVLLQQVCVREGGGYHTAEYAQILLRMGFPVQRPPGQRAEGRTVIVAGVGR